jgi:hypothetical protein
MSDLVLAALIGVSGSVLVAIVSVITQLFITKNVINANYNSLLDQIDYNELSRTREKRLDKISETVSELLSVSDAELIDKIDYAKATNLIIRAQLFLYVNIAIEYDLNQSLTTLGHGLREFIDMKELPLNNRLPETKNLMIAHSAVIEKTRIVLEQYSKETA